MQTAKHLTSDGHAADLRGKYSAAKEAVVDLASEARKSALSVATDLKKTGAKWVQEKGQTIKTKAETANVTLISYVRKNPYKSLAIAAAAGLVLGFMVRSSRR
ncbi:MAG TPA: hypothetical protein VMG59_13275 [Phycisphaerae bacterium]|nr:hypothetical protein [Phycisphaerae bacterium]